VVLLIDTTSNIGKEDFHKVKRSLFNLVDRLALDNDQTRVAIVTYSGAPRVRRFLSDLPTKTDILGALNAIEHQGGRPHLTRALELITRRVFSQKFGDRESARNYVVLVTPGPLYSEYDVDQRRHPKHHGMHVIGNTRLIVRCFSKKSMLTINEYNYYFKTVIIILFK